MPKRKQTKRYTHKYKLSQQRKKSHTKSNKNKTNKRYRPYGRYQLYQKQKGGAINIYGQKVTPVITGPMQWDD